MFWPVPEKVGASAAKHVSTIGLLEARFTMKELREMINPPEVSIILLETSSDINNPILTRPGSCNYFNRN